MGRIPVAILVQPENALVFLARQPDGLLARQVLLLLPLRAPCVEVVHVEDSPHVEQVRLQTRGARLRQTTGAGRRAHEAGAPCSSGSSAPSRRAWCTPGGAGSRAASPSWPQAGDGAGELERSPRAGLHASDGAVCRVHLCQHGQHSWQCKRNARLPRTIVSRRRTPPAGRGRSSSFCP